MSQKRRRRPALVWTLGGLALTAAIGLPLALAARVPKLWAYLLAINAATFAWYAWDKAAARAGRRRIPERTLHAMALAGGSPAALAARHLLRHKTIKGRFRAVFWAVVAVQVAAAAAWLWLQR